MITRFGLTWRYAGLAACLLVFTFTMSGCFIQPDRTLDPLTVDLLTPQPLPTAIPQGTLAYSPESTQTPAPAIQTDGGADWLNWGGQADETLVTERPANAGASWQTSASDYNAGYPVLKLGSDGSDVYDLQERLKELGYYTGALDGKFASGTQSAVIAFQKGNGLTADGIAGRATQDRMYSSSAAAAQISVAAASPSYTLLKPGSQGADVRKLQVRLYELRYYSGGADGIFGSTTEAAVKSFQRGNNLTADGLAGEQTQKKLYGSSAIAASKPVATADPGALRSLKTGMEGNDVYGMQVRLIELRYLSGVADGVFGPETEAALIVFQKSNGLKADGVAGVSTQSKLAGNAKAAGTKPSATATLKPGTYAVLREGDSGQYVYDLQERLYDLGYYAGRIDGRFESNTTGALKAFQSANNLTVDGIAGSVTQTRLFSNNANKNPMIASTPAQATPAPPPTENYAVLREGSNGTAVIRLQQYLNDLGYYYGRVDGIFGADTADAVHLFQHHNGLTEDGIAGPTTQAALFGGSAAFLPGSAATPVPNMNNALSEGSSGGDVRQMQARLYQLRYLEAEYISGNFDAATTAAVMVFQQRHGLASDGVAGPATLEALYSIQAETLLPGD